jgi:hypothetical protein
MPANYMTPRHGVHGGIPGAPPQSVMGNPLLQTGVVVGTPNANGQYNGGGQNPNFPGPPPPPANPGGGGGHDPYLTGIGATELPDSYRRMGAEVYWTIRRTSRSIVEYLERTYPGDKADAGYYHLLTLGQNTDTTLEQRYREQGLPGVVAALANENTVEVALNTIAATYHAVLHGDPHGAQEMLAFRPPGAGGLLPTWALADARAASKLGYQEAERHKYGWGAKPTSAGGPPLVNLRRRNEPQLPKDPKAPKAPKPKPPKG